MNVLTEETMRARLEVPAGRIDAILDTDTFNEVDDQFALAYALFSPEKINLRAVTAAPFFNDRSSGPGDGMEKSYEEIQRILKLAGRDSADFAWRGSANYLPDRHTPVDSPAARRIVELAREAKAAGKVIYVLGIAALTNISSALLMAPEIIDSVVVIWLGGQPHHWPTHGEFNYAQDVPLVQVPCASVAELLMVTIPELDVRCKVLGPLGEFLYERTSTYMKERNFDSKVIWDIATVAWFTVPETFASAVHPAPTVDDEGAYRQQPGRHLMRTVYHIGRDAVFTDLFNRLKR